MEGRNLRPRWSRKAYRVRSRRKRTSLGRVEMNVAKWERVFTSRKRTMMRKAMELETLTQSEVTLTIKTSAGQIWYYTTTDDLRQRLANAGIIDSSSFRDTKETIESNLVSAPEMVNRSDPPAQQVHGHTHDQPSATPSARVSPCTNCEPSRSSHMRKESLGKSSCHSRPAQRYSSTKPNRKNEKTTNSPNEHFQEGPGQNRFDKSTLRNNHSRSVKVSRAFQVANRIPNNIGGSSKSFNQGQGKSITSKPKNKEKSNLNGTMSTQARESRAEKVSSQKSGSNGRTNSDIGRRVHCHTKNVSKNGMTTRNPRERKHIFSESEDATPDLILTPPCHSSNQSNKKIPRNDKGNTSVRSQKSANVITRSIPGFARFPFQPPQHKFSTQAQLEEEMKLLPPCPPVTLGVQKSKTTSSAVSDTSSLSSSDSSSDSEDESRIHKPIEKMKAQRHLQTVTTVETLDPSCDSPNNVSHTAAQTKSKFESMGTVGCEAFCSSQSDHTMGNGSHVKIEKNPYDFSPFTYLPQTNSDKDKEEICRRKENINCSVAEGKAGGKEPQKPQTRNHFSKILTMSSEKEPNQEVIALENLRCRLESTGTRPPESLHPDLKMKEGRTGLSNNRDESSARCDGRDKNDLTGSNLASQKAKPAEKPMKGSDNKLGSQVKPLVRVSPNCSPNMAAGTTLTRSNSRKRCCSESSNCSYKKKGQSQTPDERPPKYSRRSTPWDRRNSESSSGGQNRHFGCREQQNLGLQAERIETRYHCYQQEMGPHRKRFGTPWKDPMQTNFPTEKTPDRNHDLRTRSQIKDSTFGDYPLPGESEWSKNRTTSASAPRTSSFSRCRNPTITSLPGTSHSNRSSYRHDHYSEEWYGPPLYKNFNCNFSYTQDDFEKQLKDKCFSLRDNPPKYQRFDEPRGAGGWNPKEGNRNTVFGKHLRDLSESTVPSRHRSWSPSGVQKPDFNKLHSSSKHLKIQQRRPVSMVRQSNCPRPTTLKKVVAKVKPFNSTRKSSWQK